MSESLHELLPRLANVQQGLAQWHELAERLTSDGNPVDHESAGFLLWSLGSLARSLVAIDDELEDLFGPEPVQLVAARPPLELVQPLTGAPGSSYSRPA